MSHHKGKHEPLAVQENLPEDELKKVFDTLKQNFEKHQTSKISDKGRWDYEFRMRNIKGLIRFVTENEQAILEASNKDVGRTSGEWVLEKSAILGDMKLIKNKLRKWMKPERHGTPLWMLPSKSFVTSEPYGVTLVLGTWNYNITLSLLPVAGSLAAGNACVLKPSELAPHQAKVMGQLLPHYLDPECFRVLLGDATFAGNLTDKIPWDFVFFTGSTRVGAIVATSCARRLIPCALELGGKSPTIVDKDCDLTVACRRIVQSKFVNCGATCVAPDYLIVIGDEDRKKEVLTAVDAEIRRQLTDDPATSKNYGHLVNEVQFKRMESLVKGGKVFRGGKMDASRLYVEPTLLDSVDLESPLMQEEIFGPLLPTILCATVDEAIAFVRARPKPLALYIFSSNTQNVTNILSHTTAGSSCVNEAVFQYLNPHLPFGGVGPSGSGSYHGKASFDEFSHKKSVLWRGTAFDVKQRYPPFIGEKRVQKAFSFLMAL